MSDGADFAFLALMLILPLSALIARRLPIGNVLKMALAWIAIFAVLILVVSNWERIAPPFRAIGDTLGLNDQSVSGETVRIRMAQDGHFYADVTINGVRRRMLVDSGATTTAISSATAKAAGLSLDDGPDVILNIANGTITARRSTAAASAGRRIAGIRRQRRDRHELPVAAQGLAGRGQHAGAGTTVGGIMMKLPLTSLFNRFGFNIMYIIGLGDD